MAPAGLHGLALITQIAQKQKPPEGGLRDSSLDQSSNSGHFHFPPKRTQRITHMIVFTVSPF